MAMCHGIVLVHRRASKDIRTDSDIHTDAIDICTIISYFHFYTPVNSLLASLTRRENSASILLWVMVKYTQRPKINRDQLQNLYHS